MPIETIPMPIARNTQQDDPLEIKDISSLQRWFLILNTLGLLWMSGFGMGYWSTKYAYEQDEISGSSGGMYATWIWVALALLHTFWGTAVTVNCALSIFVANKNF